MTNIEILNEIREYRNKQLTDLKDNSVFFTEAMLLENDERPIYRIIEEYSVGYNKSKIREFFYEYTDKPELIAVILDSEKPEILSTNVINEENKMQWELLTKNIEEGRIKSKQNSIKNALESGIEETEINGLSEIDIDKKLFNNKKDLDNKIETDKDSNKKQENNDETEINLTKEQAKKIGIIGMNTMMLDQKVGIHGETLKSELGLSQREEYSDVDAIEIIPTYKLSVLGVNIPNVPFVPVARHKDGSVEAFPKSVCEVYKGENTEITKIDGTEDKVTRENSNTIIQFAGKNTSLTIDQHSPYGIAEASLAYNTRDNNGRIAINLQDKYDGTKTLDYEAREIIDPHQGTENYKKMAKESLTHPQDEEIERKDADGKENTVGHLHENSIVNFEGREAQFALLAQSIGGCQTQDEIAELLNLTNQKVTDDSITPEMAIKMAIQERNKEIIQNSSNPQKVEELMRIANIENPNSAIEALENNNWEIEEAIENLGRYKGDTDYQ